jgi:hypothetical protein
MIRTRRSALLLVLAVAVLLGAALPAHASFSDTATVTTAVGTLTVAGPGNVRVDTSCITTTTVTKRTYQRGSNRQVAFSEIRTTATSRSNVESDTTTTTDGPAPNEYTVTRTVKDTRLHATAKWDASNSRGVTGYTMTAFLNNGFTESIGIAAPSATSYSESYDADVIAYGARLSMTTLTSYGWTASGNLSNVVSC